MARDGPPRPASRSSCRERGWSASCRRSSRVGTAGGHVNIVDATGKYSGHGGPILGSIPGNPHNYKGEHTAPPEMFTDSGPPEQHFVNPLFPALRSGPTAGSGAYPKSKFLAADRVFHLVALPVSCYLILPENARCWLGTHERSVQVVALMGGFG